MSVDNHQLLFSVNSILGFHLQDGQESELTPSGPQTLSLLMARTNTSVPEAEEDFCLYLHLPPEVDIALPATTRIYRQPPNSYLIPRPDLNCDTGAFIRIQFPDVGSGPYNMAQEDVDTFESILAQCTAFHEHAVRGDHVPYGSTQYGSEEGYISQDSKPVGAHGRIVLVDEENGSTVGEMTEGYHIVEGQGVKPGSKNPVEVQLPAEGEGNTVNVNNVSEEYLTMARLPMYKDSTIVQSSAQVSRLIVTGSTLLSNALTAGAESFARKTNPSKPVTFSEATQSRIRKIGNFSHGAADLSSKAVEQVSKHAQNFGASLARHRENGNKGNAGKHENSTNQKPGVLNKSMIAFSTITDGIECGARSVLTSSATAASTIISHRYGPDAGLAASELTGSFKNVGLVYIDSLGVSRKAVLKSAAKGMIVGRMRDGRQVLVGSSDEAEVPHVKGSSSKGELGAYGCPEEAVSPSPKLPPPYSSSYGQPMSSVSILEKR